VGIGAEAVLPVESPVDCQGLPWPGGQTQGFDIRALGIDTTVQRQRHHGAVAGQQADAINLIAVLQVATGP